VHPRILSRAAPCPDHPYFVAVQFHPEYLSRPLKPSPVFVGLMLAASGLLDDYLAGKKIVGF